MFTLEVESSMDGIRYVYFRIGEFHGRDGGMFALELESSMDGMRVCLL